MEHIWEPSYSLKRLTFKGAAKRDWKLERVRLCFKADYAMRKPMHR